MPDTGEGEVMEMETVAYPVLHCRRCHNAKRGGKGWVARTEKIPRTCPDCKSPYWQRERLTREERKRPFLAQCPLCSWRVPFSRQITALKKAKEHMEAVHGKEATERYLKTGGNHV
jgi:hypothetical protein